MGNRVKVQLADGEWYPGTVIYVLLKDSCSLCLVKLDHGPKALCASENCIVPLEDKNSV